MAVRCGYCDTEFQSREALQTHMKVCGETPEVPDNAPVYECAKCGATFVKPAGLQAHRQSCRS